MGLKRGTLVKWSPSSWPISSMKLSSSVLPCSPQPRHMPIIINCDIEVPVKVC